MEHIKFLTNILKPWDELNELLSQPFAVQPDISDLTRQVESIAVSLSHYREQEGGSRKRTSLMNDIADTAKHGSLRDQNRITLCAVSSCFLCDENDRFLFLRNIPFITYKTNQNQTFDFMSESLAEIKDIMASDGINVGRNIDISQSVNAEYEGVIRLKFDTKYCLHMDSASLRTFKENSDGELVSYAPKEVRFELY